MGARGRGGKRWSRRLGQLYLGLALFGLSMAMIVRARLGVMPWDVLHQGLARRTHLSLGTVVLVVGVAVLLAWIPMRQRPGFGTVSNALVIGVMVDQSLRLLPAPAGLAARLALLLGGIALNAVATAAYIGARLGPGPRDGLMTGLVARRGWPVRWVRTGIEVAVVLLGWALGGNLGLGTLLFAVTIGPLVHPLLPRMSVQLPEPVPVPAVPAAGRDPEPEAAASSR